MKSIYICLLMSQNSVLALDPSSKYNPLNAIFISPFSTSKHHSLAMEKKKYEKNISTRIQINDMGLIASIWDVENFLPNPKNTFPCVIFFLLSMWFCRASKALYFIIPIVKAEKTLWSLKTISALLLPPWDLNFLPEFCLLPFNPQTPNDCLRFSFTLLSPGI